MPRPTRAQKYRRKAKAEALKASEASTTGNDNDNTISTSNSAPCSTSPHLVSNGGETRILTAGERKQETATKSNASEVVQDKKPEKSGVVIGKERSDGGERGPGESKQENATIINASEVVQDKRRIDALGRALSGILRHKAPQLGLKVRSDGYVVVKDLLSLHTKTPAGLPLNAHSVDDLKEAVNRDNKQRFGLREEKGQLLIRANQGHSLETINSADLLKQVLSAEEVPVGRGDDDALLERPMSQVCISPLLPSSAGAQSHHEHGEPNGAAATMPTTTIPITLSETPTTLVDPDWQEGDPVGTQGWRDFVSNVITGMVTSIGTQRPVWTSHGLQRSAGRHEDIFEPVAQLRADLEALRDEVEQRGAVEERLHRENLELGVEVARLRGIIEWMEMMRNSRSHS